MITPDATPYGFIIVQSGRIVYADPQLARLCAGQAQFSVGADAAAIFLPEDRRRVRQALHTAAEQVEPVLISEICPGAWEEAGGCIDILVSRTIFDNEPALQLLCVDRRVERQRQQEAEVMRDVLAALASASDLKQTLEALLVNLHGLIHYDRAGLFLVDENERIVLADRAANSAAAVHLDEDPLVAEMRRTRRPLVVADVQQDSRFDRWPDIQSVRGWLGAPLLAGDQMLGFISLGALSPRAYEPGRRRHHADVRLPGGAGAGAGVGERAVAPANRRAGGAVHHLLRPGPGGEQRSRGIGQQYPAGDPGAHHPLFRSQPQRLALPGPGGYPPGGQGQPG